MISQLPVPHGGVLIDRRVNRDRKRSVLRSVNRRYAVEISDEMAMDVARIADGSYSPLSGFMDRHDYSSVLKNKRLKSGLVWTVPITFDIPKKTAKNVRAGEALVLKHKDKPAAILRVKDKFIPDKLSDARMIFSTADQSHPGVKGFISKGEVFVGGELEVIGMPQIGIPAFALEPRQTRRIFIENGWNTVAAFHSRNVVHRAHEFLQKAALQITDGLFIHPLIGRTKPGDFLPEVIMKGYQRFIKSYYPARRVILSALTCAMKFAGPREAVFHALIRKNYGCSHFIVGRDHAGVGGFYGKYAAHDIFDEVGDLGIDILRFSGPYYCKKCKDVVTEKTCPHPAGFHEEISGTRIRRSLSEGKMPVNILMRPEVARFLLEESRINHIFSK